MTTRNKTNDYLMQKILLSQQRLYGKSSTLYNAKCTTNCTKYNSDAHIIIDFQ
jgi:hypothetical protein